MIYLDNNATTSLDPACFEAMQALFSKCLNPSSVHSFGKEAKKLLEEARKKLSSYLNVDPSEITFTSGGTESMNTVIKGLYRGYGKILSTRIEHSCVYETLQDLDKKFKCVEFIEVSKEGSPSVETIEKHLGKETSLLVFSAVYSETGAMPDLKALAELASYKGIPLIIDGVALLGKETFTIPKGVTAMGFSGHKLHGPRGVGAFFLDKEAHFAPLLRGGHQEGGKRAGTEAVEAICGFGVAVDLIKKNLPEASDRIRALRDRFETLLCASLFIRVNGVEKRVCNTSSVTFLDIDGETLLLALERKGVLASMGSACSSGALEPSRILLNMGFTRKEAKSTLRFSLSRLTTEQEIEKAAAIIIEIVQKLSTPS